ncbi:MAG: hypothetical protein J6P45_07915 [Lachnospiraceae bacterium]|nr:hypothetical protein [Lachnospiraceae bacterium]
MNSRTENANVLNDAPELSADMKAVKRLTATNLDQETLQRALRLYGNEHPDMFSHKKEDLSIDWETLNTCHKTAEERVDFYTAQFEKSIKAEKNESLDKNEPEYIIEVPDKKIKKCGGEPVEKPLFGEDGKRDLSTVREDRAGADCYIIAVLQSLARYDPDYITKHLIKDDPKDPKWAIVTLFDEMGRKQKIRVQKTPILKGGIDPDERALWVQCVTKAAVVLIGKDVTNRFGDYVHYRHHDEKEKGGHDYEHHKIKDKSLDLRGLAMSSFSAAKVSPKTASVPSAFKAPMRARSKSAPLANLSSALRAYTLCRTSEDKELLQNKFT